MLKIDYSLKFIGNHQKQIDLINKWANIKWEKDFYEIEALVKFGKFYSLNIDFNFINQIKA